MRGSLRLLAGVKSATRYFEPGAQTGLAGLYTHSTPRATLLYLYATTLDKLQAVPETSVYRQSVEAVTKHRMALVEAAKPKGYEEWRARAQKLVAAHPEQFGTVTHTDVDGAAMWRVSKGKSTFIIQDLPEEQDGRLVEWDGERDEGGELEGPRSAEEREDQVLSATRKPLEELKAGVWEEEPQLTADQIEDLENKIGGGLIEEVISVAEGEAKLVDVMVKAKIWESLDEKPAEGQWAYFERK